MAELTADGMLTAQVKFDFSGKEAYEGVSKATGKKLGELDISMVDDGPPGETPKQKRKRLAAAKKAAKAKAKAEKDGKGKGAAGGAATGDDGAADDKEIPDTFNQEQEQVDYQELFDEIDTDGSGEISFEEFSIWFNTENNKQLFAGLVDPIDQIEQNIDMFYDR